MTEYVCVDKDFKPLSRNTSVLTLAHGFAKMESLGGYDCKGALADSRIVIVCESKTLTPEAFYFDGEEYQ